MNKLAAFMVLLLLAILAGAYRCPYGNEGLFAVYRGWFAAIHLIAFFTFGMTFLVTKVEADRLAKLSASQQPIFPLPAFLRLLLFLPFVIGHAAFDASSKRAADLQTSLRGRIIRISESNRGEITLQVAGDNGSDVEIKDEVGDFKERVKVGDPLKKNPGDDFYTTDTQMIWISYSGADFFRKRAAKAHAP